MIAQKRFVYALIQVETVSLLTYITAYNIRRTL